MATANLLGDGFAVTLHQLVHEIDGYAEQLLQTSYGISYSQYHFLAVTSTLDRPDVTGLADCLGVSKAAVSKRLDGLVADGWITLGSDPAHARRVIVQLTPRAEELVTTATEHLERDFTVAVSSLPPGEIDDLTGRLHRILDLFVAKRETGA